MIEMKFLLLVFLLNFVESNSAGRSTHSLSRSGEIGDTTKRQIDSTKSFQLERQVEFDEVTTKKTTRKPTTTNDPMLVDLESPRATTKKNNHATKKSSSSDPLIPFNDPDLVEIAPLPDVGPHIGSNDNHHNNGQSQPMNSQTGSRVPEMDVDTSFQSPIESCYSGFSVVNTETVATGKQQCEEVTDYCYNATITGPVIGTVGKAGCSTSRCKLANALNRCVDIDHLGYHIHFCCCNTGNLCNSKYTNLNIIEQGLERVKDGMKFLDKILDLVG